MYNLLTIKNFINKLNQSKLTALVYIGLLIVLFFVPFSNLIIKYMDSSHTITSNYTFYSIFSFNILLFCQTDLYVKQLVEQGYNLENAMELIRYEQSINYSLYIVQFLFVIFIIISAIYLLLSSKNLKKFNILVFSFDLLLFFIYYIALVNNSNFAYNIYDNVLYTFNYSTAFYLSISFLVIIILLSLAYLILSLYFKKHPEATLIDKNKTIKPRKPTNKERIAELEQQVQDLQDKINNQE